MGGGAERTQWCTDGSISDCSYGAAISCEMGEIGRSIGGPTNLQHPLPVAV